MKTLLRCFPLLLLMCLDSLQAQQPVATALTVLNNFGGNSGQDGKFPQNGLVLYGDSLYGITSAGGDMSFSALAQGGGTIFKVRTNGTGFAVLKVFSPAMADGFGPVGGLTLSDGMLYGTTDAIYDQQPSQTAQGCVFRLNPDGTGYTLLKVFDYNHRADGTFPRTDLTLAGGTLFGTTVYDGTAGNGTVFRINPDGAGFASVYSFTNGNGGAMPVTRVQVSGNTIYGTTIYPAAGGTVGDGRIYKVNTDGSGFAVLKEFLNEGVPANLTVAGNSIYGTISRGGVNFKGAVFKMNTDGTGYALLKSFGGPDGHIDTVNGAALTLEGNTLYGTTDNGGTNSSNAGTIFQINTDGTGFLSLYSFGSGEARGLASPLIVAGNTLYGASYNGGPHDQGMVFKLDLLYPPKITTPPANQLVMVSSSAGFSVAASGTLPLAYQWRFSGTGIADATNATLTIANAQLGSEGSYDVVITNAYGSITSAPVTLTVLAPPQITVPPPANVTNIVGTTAQFGVTATGRSPLAFQWLLGASAVPDATNAILTLTNIQPSHAGNYSVVVTNTDGAVTSSVVALTVIVLPPSITTPPTEQSFTLGSDVTLSVVAGGTGPLFYQWLFNGTNLPGATSALLSLTNLSAANAGAYQVVITNAVGTISSLPVDVHFFGDLKLMAAAVLAGSVGQQYRVDYADVINVGTTNWQVLTNITLPHSPYLVIDPGSPGQTRRFYRAVPLP